MRKTKNPINKLETPSKVKKGFRTYVALVLACTCMREASERPRKRCFRRKSSLLSRSAASLKASHSGR